MRNAYALLGFLFLLVFGSATFLLNKAEAPAPELYQAGDNTSMKLLSSAFTNNQTIPAKYSCDGENINPPFSIVDAPAGTKSFVLVMDDPDIPAEIKEQMGLPKFNHWALYNIPADTIEIPENFLGSNVGLNSRSEANYRGPCPPPEYAPTEHRYIFRVYALSGQLNFIKTPTLDEIEQAAQGSALDKAELVGLYDRSGL